MDNFKHEISFTNCLVVVHIFTGPRIQFNYNYSVSLLIRESRQAAITYLQSRVGDYHQAEGCSHGLPVSLALLFNLLCWQAVAP